jgi:beta-aspartyl-peptidase (threonine type)
MQPGYAIALHGGAGTILRSAMTPEKDAAYRKSLQEAILFGEKILKEGGHAVDAVEKAIRVLEDNPLFNAGRGSVFTSEGKNEMDASIMNGQDLRAGAVSGITNVKNPITLARTVMYDSEHVFLAGSGAVEFAKMHHIEFAPDEYFFVPMRFEQLQQAKKTDSITLDHTEENIHQGKPKKTGTVGAVAMDRNGNLAAGTSTGGMTNKKHGRVGDSPMIGAGTYANNKTCAVSCTGHGEYFIRCVVAYDISCLIEYKGLTLKEACDLVVYDKLVKIGGEGGLIALDSHGNIEMPFNSEGMYRASKKENSDLFIGIYGD